MRKILIIIWLATIIASSLTSFIIGNHVSTGSINDAEKSVIYKFPSGAIGIPEIESINVVSYIANGRNSSCLLIKCAQPLNGDSEIVNREKIYKSIDAILGPGSSAINEIASSFYSGGSLVASGKTMVVFINKARDIIIIPNYTLK